MIINLTKAMCEVAEEIRGLAEKEDDAMRRADTLDDKRDHRVKSQAYRTAAHKIDYALKQQAYLEREVAGGNQ